MKNFSNKPKSFKIMKILAYETGLFMFKYYYSKMPSTASSSTGSAAV